MSISQISNVAVSREFTEECGSPNTLIRDGGGRMFLLPPRTTLLVGVSAGTAGVMDSEEGIPSIPSPEPPLPPFGTVSLEGVVEREMGGENIPTPLRASEASGSIGIGKGNQTGSPRWAGLPRRSVSEEDE